MRKIIFGLILWSSLSVFAEPIQWVRPCSWNTPSYVFNMSPICVGDECKRKCLQIVGGPSKDKIKFCKTVDNSYEMACVLTINGKNNSFCGLGYSAVWAYEVAECDGF